MIESDARKLWCPMVRFSGPKGENNREAGLGYMDDAHCIASKCAVWVWDGKQANGEYDSAYHAKRPENRKGYCGLIR